MDPVQNLSIKIKKYRWTWSTTGGPWNRSKSGGSCTPGPCFVLWIQSNHRIEFSNLSFPIAHLPAGRLTCANSGEIFVANPQSSGFMNGGRQNFPPIGLVTVFGAILTSRQTCEKLQCLYENLMYNNSVIAWLDQGDLKGLLYHHSSCL